MPCRAGPHAGQSGPAAAQAAPARPALTLCGRPGARPGLAPARGFPGAQGGLGRRRRRRRLHVVLRGRGLQLRQEALEELLDLVVGQRRLRAPRGAQRQQRHQAAENPRRAHGRGARAGRGSGALAAAGSSGPAWRALLRTALFRALVAAGAGASRLPGAGSPQPGGGGGGGAERSWGAGVGVWAEQPRCVPGTSRSGTLAASWAGTDGRS